MGANQQIFLYGNSVIIGSIGARLRRCSQFDVTTLTPPLHKTQAFDVPKPDIVLFDLEAHHTEDVLFLLKTNPSILMIGINPGDNVVRVWRSQQMQDISLLGLMELINQGTIGGHNPAPDESPDVRKIYSCEEQKYNGGMSVIK
jgi:hypothetical protein